MSIIKATATATPVNKRRLLPPLLGLLYPRVTKGGTSRIKWGPGRRTHPNNVNKEEKMEINKKDTAVLLTDPQNDFLSETGVTWELVGE